MYVIIVGCGKIGSYLAKLLEKDNDVVVIDKDEKSFEKLSEFNGIQIVGDGLDIDVLKEGGIEKADCIAVTTSNDNTNIVIGQIAKKKFNVPKVLVRISDPHKEKICKGFGIETINTTTLISSLILDGLKKKIALKYLIEDGNFSVVEINSENFVKRRINEINKKDEFLTIAVIRENEGYIPDENFIIEKGDIVIGITKTSLLNKFKKIIKQ